MEKHVYSILAKDFQRKKRKTHKPIRNKNTHKYRQVTLHTNEKGRQDPALHVHTHEIVVSALPCRHLNLPPYSLLSSKQGKPRIR